MRYKVRASDGQSFREIRSLAREKSSVRLENERRNSLAIEEDDLDVLAALRDLGAVITEDRAYDPDQKIA